MRSPVRPNMSPRSRFLTLVKSLLLSVVLLVGTLLIIALIYRYTFGRNQALIFGAIAMWGVLAYIVIPRLHRRLTKLYLPNYYIGRTRTAEGLLGDPVNLAFIGKNVTLSKRWRQLDGYVPMP